MRSKRYLYFRLKYANRKTSCDVFFVCCLTFMRQIGHPFVRLFPISCHEEFYIHRRSWYKHLPRSIAAGIASRWRTIARNSRRCVDNIPSLGSRGACMYSAQETKVCRNYSKWRNNSSFFKLQSAFWQFQTITVSECCLIKLLPYILFKKYIYILTLKMARPGNQHCVNCIGTLSFPTDVRLAT